MTEPAQTSSGSHSGFMTWSRWAYLILAAALLVHFGLYLRSAVVLFPFPYEFKGWAGGQMMYTAGQLAQGENFYLDPAKQPSAAYCYTPGFQFLAAPLIRVFGNEMWVGRVVAVAGLMLVWLLMYLAVRRGGGDRWTGLLAIGLLMAPYASLSSHYDDIHPDSWCVAMGLLCLAATEAAVRRKNFWIVAALFGFLSFAFKQTGLSFAAGAFFFLLPRQPRQAVGFGILLAALIAVFLIVGQSLTDGMFLDYILFAAGKQPVIWTMVPLAALLLLIIFPFVLPVGGYLLVKRPRLLPLDRVYALALPFVAVLYGSASIRRGGDILSNVFPAAVLTSILLAVAVSRIERELRRSEPKVAFILLALLALQGMWLFRQTPSVPTPEHYRTGREIDRIIQSTPGEVLVFYRLSFAYRNHRPIYDNWGLYSDHVNWTDYSRLENQVRQRFFTRILIPKKAIDLWMSEQPVYRLLQENYDLERAITQPAWHQTTPMLVFSRKPPDQGRNAE